MALPERQKSIFREETKRAIDQTELLGFALLITFGVPALAFTCYGLGVAIAEIFRWANASYIIQQLPLR